MSETDIKKTIIDGIRREFPSVTIFRVFCGTAKGASHRFIHGAETGTPDLCGFLPDGRFLGIEVKTAKGHYRPEQHDFAIKAARAGCAVFGAASWDEAREKLMDALQPVLPFAEVQR